jgi:AcrR family transcriptional regulator
MVGELTPKAEVRRMAVLEASTEIFSRQGYRGTTMNDIAAEVGLGKPSLYHYFKSKEEILVRLYENVLAEGVAAAQAVVDETPDPLEAFRKLLVSRVTYTCENLELLKIFFEEEGELPKRLSRKMLERRGGFERILQSVVADYLDQSGTELKTSVTVYVNTCLGAVNWTYKWFNPAGPLTPAELGNEMADLLIAPLLGAVTA